MFSKNEKRRSRSLWSKLIGAAGQDYHFGSSFDSQVGTNDGAQDNQRRETKGISMHESLCTPAIDRLIGSLIRRKTREDPAYDGCESSKNIGCFRSAVAEPDGQRGAYGRRK